MSFKMYVSIVILMIDFVGGFYYFYLQYARSFLKP